MKILYLTHEYGNRWFKYPTFLRKLGHQVDLIKLKDKRTPNQVLAKQYSPKYDIVWAFAADYIFYKVLSDDFIEKVKNGRSLFVGHCSLPRGISFDKWVDSYKIFDVCFLRCHLAFNLAKAAGLTDVYFMPYGFDKDKYYKINIKKKYNVSFMGSAQTSKSPEEDDRAQTINALKDFNIKVFGKSLKTRVSKSIKVSGFRTHRKMNKVYNQSKINLNLALVNSPLPEFANKNQIKSRFYEIPGSGNFMISGYADIFESQFKDGIHCSYYHNIDDLCSKVEYFLTHEKEREEIARAGYEHALKNHQTIFKIRDMINIIKEKYL